MNKKKLINKIKKLNFKDKRILILTVISILSILVLTSTSFALFFKSHETNQKNFFSTGDLAVTFNDDSGNVISLNPTKPMSDEYARTLNPYSFTIKNNGSYKSTYEIRLVDSDNLTEDSINKLKPVLKFQIDNNTPLYLKDTDNQILVSGKLSAGQTKTHELRIWVAYEATEEIENLTYSGSVSVTGKAINYIKFSTENKDFVSLNDTTLGNTFKNLKLYGNSIQNGTPIPSTPVEIQSVGDYDETTEKYKIPITISGKNLFNPKHNFSSYSGNGITIKYIEDEDAYVLNGTATATVQYATRSISIPNIKGSSYSLSTKYVSGKITRTKDTDYAIAYFGGADSLSSTYTNWQTAGLHEYDYKKQNVQCNYNYINKFWFYITKGVSFENYKVKIQLEQNNTATSYEQYIEPVTHDIYLDEPLRAIGDYKDYIDFENGKVVRNVEKVDLSTKTFTQSNTQNIFYSTILNIKGSPVLSNYNRVVNYNNASSYDYCLYTINTSGSIFIKNIDFDNVDDFNIFNASLKENYLYMPLLSPDDKETIELPEIKTLDGTTILSTNNSVKGILEGSY